jgi:hypothetical protein
MAEEKGKPPSLSCSRYTENMEITRRRSERAKVKKATYTPGKLVTKARNKIPPEANK